MSRAARLILPDVPLHITQRGVDRCPTFLTEQDFAFYRLAIGEACRRSRCALHAYVLMTNHVHLLVTPADVTGPARMMRSLGARYVHYFNHRYRRSGTLWEGRYRAARVDSTRYLLACSRYIEMNPVRAGIVDAPGEYEWSSFRPNAWGDDDAMLTPLPAYTSLGADRATRCAAYCALFAADAPPGDAIMMRAALRGRPMLHATPYWQAIHAMIGDAVRTGHEADRADADRRLLFGAAAPRPAPTSLDHGSVG